MKENANINLGLDNSEYIMMQIAQHIGKDQAHELVYELAIEAELTHQSYKEILLANKIVGQLFTAKEIEDMLKPENYIGLSAAITKDVVTKSKETIRSFNERSRQERVYV